MTLTEATGLTPYQREKLDEVLNWARKRVVKLDLFLPNQHHTHRSWIISLLLQILAARIFVIEADLHAYLRENGLPEAPLNRRGFFIAEALLCQIYRPTLSCFDRIHALEQELLLELARPLAADKLSFLWDFAKQYPSIQTFETWAEDVKAALRPQKPHTGSTMFSEPIYSANLSRTETAARSMSTPRKPKLAAKHVSVKPLSP